MRRPLWKIHVLTLLLLTGVNVYLLIKLLHCTENTKEAKDLKAEWKKQVAKKVEASISQHMDQLEAGFGSLVDVGEDDLAEMPVARWDASRQYQIQEFFLVGSDFGRMAMNQAVCLATQSSLDRLYWLSHVAQQWRGAISVSVFLENDQVTYFRHVIRHLQRCHAELLFSIAFHVVTGRPADTSRQSPIDVADQLNCTTATQDMEQLLKNRPELSKKWTVEGKAYPQNLMRNVARKGCPADYVLLVDVDVIPSYNMAQDIAQFLDQSPVADCAKCAFVVPTYELDLSAPFPANKSQLLLLENQGRAQPFHLKAFRFNQFASNLTRWRQTGETDQVIISHNVTNYEFFYEPFYVSKDNAPPHDERFVGYGFTRNTQVYEMALAGWTFHVLSPIFTIHWGLQSKQRRPSWRRNQMEINRRLFDTFIHPELKARYGQKSPVRWHPKPAINNRKTNSKPIAN